MNTNVNTKYPPMKGGNNEHEYMNTMVGHLNYKTASSRYAGSNMMYMNNALGQNINPTVNHMSNQMSSMGNNMGGEMNVMPSSVHSNMNSHKNVYMNNEMNENIMNKNLYSDMNKSEKISFTNFGMNKFNNNENIKLKTDEYNKYANANQENLLMNKTQRKINFMNKNDPGMGTNMSNNMGNNMSNNMSNNIGNNIGNNMGNHMGNNMTTAISNNMNTNMTSNMGANMNSNMGTKMNILNDGNLKPFGSNLMNHNVNSTSNSILPGLNKNLNIFENTKGDNKMKKNTYENMFQNPHNNNTAMGNVNIGTRNDSNNTMHGMKNNMNTFMQGISGINKANVLPNKGVGLNMYTDNIINALNTKTKDPKLKLFDGGMNKLNETEQNNAMNNPMKQNMSLNTFTTNQTNTSINNTHGENQFGQIGRVGTMNPMQTFNTPGVNANMGNVHNNMNNLTNMNNVNMTNASLNAVNIMGMNPMGNAAGMNDPLLRKMANTSNRAVPNKFGKNILLTNSSVNNVPNSNLINPFNTTNVNKGMGMTNKGDMPVATTNLIGGVSTEKGGLNMFQKPYNSFLNMNAQPTGADNSLHVRDAAGPFNFMQSRQLRNERNKTLEVSQNNVKTGVTTSMNSMNQMNIMNRNMNMLNNNMGTIGNVDGINNMNVHVNRSDMQEMGVNQRSLMNQTGINPMGMNQMGMNYMNTVPVMGGTLMMNTVNNETAGVTNVLTMKHNEPEIKPMDAMDFRKEHLPNKPPEFALNDNTQQENVSIDNYANLLKQLCTPVKNKPAATKIETFNEDMFNFEENESANALNKEDPQAGVFKNESHAAEILGADMGNNNTVQNNFMENPMLVQNKNETNMNDFRNATVNNFRGGNKEGNIYELKKLNLFAENKKKDKQMEVENKSSQVKQSKTKVFFYMNPKYILEPLKRKIYEKMSFYIENLISDIKSIENKDRSKILEELHATSWFFQVFDFDAISKLLNVFNKYLIYSDSLIIPDVLISNKLDVDDVNNAFISGTTQASSSGTDMPGAAANYQVVNNANVQGNEAALLMKNNDMISGGDDYVKNFHFYFKKSEKLDLLNQKMHDYESNIIENVDKLNYMKELCENLKSQILLKKRTFLLLLEKAKLKNYTYRNEQLQTILNIEKKTKMDKSLELNNEYYTMFKKINEGLNILKGYSHLMVTYPNLVNDVLSCESVKMYESTKSSEEGNDKKKTKKKVVQIEDGCGGASDSNSVNVSTENKAKHKRKMEEQDKDDRDAILSMHSSFEEDEGEECKELTDLSKRKKRKTIKEIKHMHKQMENNEEWVDDFLDDF